MGQVLLEAKAISKSFPGVQALKSVDFELRAGEIHGLVGENGAGKSTMIKILTGVYTPDSGDIFFEGEKVVIDSPVKADKLGIRVVHQEISTVPYLTIADNIMLKKYPTRGLGIINDKEMLRQCQEILDALNFQIDLKKLDVDAATWERQMTQIASAMAGEGGSKVLILDEPGAVLTSSDLARLFEVLENLKKQGVAIVYISHRLEEIFSLCDRITVFKDGQKVATTPVAGLTTGDVVKMMIGRELKDMFPKREPQRGETLLEVNELNADNVENVSFQVTRGEVLGITGFVGCGKEELAQALFRVLPSLGTIKMKGKTYRTIKGAIENGIGWLTEDRKATGLLLDFSVAENTTLVNWLKVHKGGLIRKATENRIAQEYVDRLRVRTPNLEQYIKHLSGGNQQKVCIAKWLLADCDVLVFSEPTRGVDVGARGEIYTLVNEMVAGGKAVILMSTDFDEIVGMCDRVLVMYRGRINGELQGEEINKERVIHLASGGNLA